MDAIDTDIKGNLETISNLALIGIYLIDQDKKGFIPTLLEDIFEHSQRLVDDYAIVKES